MSATSTRTTRVTVTASTTTTTRTTMNGSSSLGADVVISTSSKHRSYSKRSQSAHSAGMESSVLRFKDIDFVVGGGNGGGEPKYILRDVSGKVKWSRVLAIMGPSGAGKTTLINALTLDATYGKTTGKVTLNGVPMTDQLFKSHCYVVVQKDKHWPYLTCRETLLYAAQLYDVAATPTDLEEIVDEIIEKMGLQICAQTRNFRLSGGQARRLSIGMALLKQPTLLFLDEPTTGLDAAAAENIMQEIVRVAKDERLIILCTIHQPSTKVYNGFDQVMILSKGREAYTGDVKDATDYFARIGHALPEQTNPAEHFLDLVNSDFSDEIQVDEILDTWQEKRPGWGSSHHAKRDQDEQFGVTTVKRASFMKELGITFRRCFTLMIRDPLLYSGRAVAFLLSNIVFSLVYLEARKYNQDQAFNKMWINVWHQGVASQLGVVAVYALNEEFKTILRETKNGMIEPYSYMLAKTILVLPIMFLFAVAALGIPAILIMDFPVESLGKAVIMYAGSMYVFECVAECLSVWFDDPIIGLLQYMNFWFGCFLFGGFLIAQRDMYWPFEAFYFGMPFSYYVRSITYIFLHDTTFTPCNSDENAALCIPASEGMARTSGGDVLRAMGTVYGVIENNDTFVDDITVLVAMAVAYKVCYFTGVMYKTGRVSKVEAR